MCTKPSPLLPPCGPSSTRPLSLLSSLMGALRARFASLGSACAPARHAAVGGSWRSSPPFARPPSPRLRRGRLRWSGRTERRRPAPRAPFRQRGSALVADARRFPASRQRPRRSPLRARARPPSGLQASCDCSRCFLPGGAPLATEARRLERFFFLAAAGFSSRAWRVTVFEPFPSLFRALYA